MDKARAEKLKKICESINKNFKERDKIATYVGNKDIVQIERFPSGDLAIDEALGGGWPVGRIVEISGSESSGKCHAKGTEILLYSGKVKKVEDIVVGDLLMGVNSKSRKVKKLAQGREKMYRITPRKGLKDSFVVNEGHVLSLKNTQAGSNFGNIVNISLKEYMSKSRNFRYYHKLYRVAVDFPKSSRKLKLEPYFLGIWLGDGSSDCVRIHNPDKEIFKYLKQYALKLKMELTTISEDKCPGHSIVVGKGKYQKNFCIQTELRSLKLLKNKHIPHEYKTASKKCRMELLAGLLDTDGYKGSGSSLVFSNTNKVLANDVLFLARSLGFFCNIKEYTARIKSINFECKAYKVYINGECLNIPLKIKRKKANKRKSNRDPLVSSFDVEPLKKGEYYGFLLDGDHLYLMGNFIVNHNTTLCYHAIAEYQKKYPDSDIAWIDSEYTADTSYAKDLGVDIEPIIWITPEYGEQAIDTMLNLMNEGIRLIIVDSVAGLVPKDELEGEFGETKEGMGAQARMMSKAMRRLNTEVGRTETTIIFTNQVRDKIGVTWGSKSTTPGGRALKFYSSIRVEVTAMNKEKEGDTVISVKTKVTVKKNKTATPFRIAEFNITFGIGIDRIMSVFEKAVLNKIIIKKGAWISYNGSNIAQGKPNCITMFREDEKFLAEVEAHIKNGTVPSVEEKDDKKTKKKGKKASAPEEKASTEAEIEEEVVVESV